MKKAAVALSLAGLAVYDASAQEAVQWRTEDGGNGHWYIGVVSPDAISWAEASERSAAKGGHLATPTSALENDFIRESVIPVLGDYPGFGPIVGGLFLAGAWQWVTGEPWEFTAWGSGEPSSPLSEPFLHYQKPSLEWNDYDGSATGYVAPFRSFIVEWSADCNSDGIVDYGQIRAGAFVDANANNIPDCCESGAPRDCAASGDGSDAANLVINGGFDEGVDGWSFANIDGAGGWRDSGGQPGGRFILNDGGAFATDPTIEQTVSGLIPRGVYRLSGGFKGESIAHSPTGGVSFAVDVDGTTSFTAAAADLTTWRSFSFDFEAASTEVAVRLRAEIGGTDNDFAIDNVALVLVSPPTCQGDVSRNGAVNAIDLAAVLGAWGTDGQGKFDCDANRDGIVDALDLAQVLSDWGPCP